MATTGKNARVLVDRHDLSSYFNNAEKTSTVDTAESTTYLKSSKTYEVGHEDGTISLSGVFDGSADAVDEELQTRIGTADVLFLIAPEGTAIGNRVDILQAHETNYNVTAPVGDLVSVSLDSQADAGIQGGVSLHDVATDETGSTNSSSVDNGSSTSNGATAHLHVTSNGRDGTLDVKVQHSSDDATWADLITFTQVAAGNQAEERKTVSGTVNQFVRVSDTIGGTSGTINYGVGFARG